MTENKKTQLDENFIDWNDGLHEQTNGRDHWSGDLKNVLVVGWPLLLYISLVLLLLLYLWWRG